VKLHPQDLTPQKANFNLVLDLWATKRTGLLLGSNGERAALVDGEPKSREHLGRVMAFIYAEEPVKFKNADSPLKRPKPILGTHLLKAAERVSKPERVRKATGAMLVPGPHAGILKQLPVPEQLREVLDGESRVSVMDVLKHDADLAEDVATLLVMKVLRLAKPSQSERLPASERRDRVNATRTALLLRRLEREWEIVKEADDYTVLGVSPDTPESEIAPAAERMQQRYAKVAEDEAAHPKARKLAQRIYQKVAAAATRMAEGSATGGSSPLPDEKTAFAEGTKNLEQGDFSRAVKWFALARKYSSNDAGNVGHLGWAVYNDPGRPKSKRHSTGRELLELSDFINPHAEGPQYFLAQVELSEGDPERARARLERLLALEPDYKPAQKLLATIRRG